MAVKVEKGNFGRSKSTGNVIRKKITITSPKRSSKSSKSSSGSSSSKKDDTRFVEGKGGTVKDTKTGRTIVPDTSKGETPESIIQKKTSSSSKVPEPKVPKPSVAENLVSSRVLTAIKKGTDPKLTPGQTAREKQINKAILQSFSSTKKQISPLVEKGGKVEVKGKDIIVTTTSTSQSPQLPKITGSISPATKSEKFRSSLPGRLTGGFLEGFTFDKQALGNIRTVKRTSSEKAVDLTTFLGGVTGVATLPFTASKIGKVASKLPQGLQRAARLSGATLVAGSVAKKGIQATAPKEQRQAASSIQFKETFKDVSLEKSSFIPVITATGKRKEEFLGTFRERISRRVPAENVDTFVKAAEKRLIASESANIAELVGIESGSEFAGRAAIKTTFKKISTSPRQAKIAKVTATKVLTEPPKGISYADFVTQAARQSTSNVVKRQALRETTTLNKFLQTAKIIAPIGAIEGGAGVISDAKKSGSLPNLKNVLGGATFGFATAGVLGPAALTLPKGRGLIGAPLKSVPRRSTKLAGALLDPLEKPVDLFVDFTQSRGVRSSLVGKKAQVAIPKPSVFTPSITPSSSITQTKSPTISQTLSTTQTKIFTPTINLAPSKPSAGIFSPSVTNTRTETKVSTSTNVPSLSSATNTNIAVPSTTSTQTITNVPTSVSTNVSTSTSTNVPSTTIVPTPLGLTLPKPTKRKKAVPGYYAKVKKGNKFKKLNQIPVSKQDAIKLGKFVTENSVAASFKPVKANKKATRKLTLPKVSNSQFKVKNGVYIEKNQFRINTAGELAGITAKGLIKQRFKKFRL
jgi:hypothetical protein